MNVDSYSLEFRFNISSYSILQSYFYLSQMESESSCSETPFVREERGENSGRRQNTNGGKTETPQAFMVFCWLL